MSDHPPAFFFRRPPRRADFFFTSRRFRPRSFKSPRRADVNCRGWGPDDGPMEEPMSTTTATLLLLAGASGAFAQDENREWIYASCGVGNGETTPILRIDPAAPPDRAVSGIISLPSADRIIDITPIPSAT